MLAAAVDDYTVLDSKLREARTRNTEYAG